VDLETANSSVSVCNLNKLVAKWCCVYWCRHIV